MDNNFGTNSNSQGLDSQNPVNPNKMGFNPGVDTNGVNANSMSENVTIQNESNSLNSVSSASAFENAINTYGNENSNTQGSVPLNMGNESMMGDIPKKNKKFLIISIIIGAVILIGVIGVVTYNIAMSSPKVIYKNSINALFKEINRGIDEAEKIEDILDVSNNAIALRGDIKADVKLDDIEEFMQLEKAGIHLKDYSFGGEVGLDLKNELIQANAYVKGDSEEIEFNVFAQDKYVYAGFNFFDEYAGQEYPELTSELEEIKKSINEIKDKYEIEAENYNYVIEAVRKAVINSLDSKNMSKNKKIISVNGKDLKVNEYNYTLNEESLEKMYESIFTSFIEDEEFLDRFSKLIGEEKSTVLESLKETKEKLKDEIELEKEEVIHIYTNGLSNKVSGFGLEYDGNDYFHCYTDGENFEVVVYEEENFEEEIKVISIKKDDIDEVTVTYQKEEIIKAYVRELTDTMIDLDYEVTVDENTFKGTICLEGKIEDKTIGGKYKFSFEYEEQYISVEGTYGIETKEKLEKKDTSKVVSAENLNQDEILKNLQDIINKDKAFKRIYDFAMENIINSSLNDYDMIDVKTVDEVRNVLGQEMAVLYVGNSNTNSKNMDELNVLIKLRNLQQTYGFTSYYYDYYVIPKEISDILATASTKCFSDGFLVEGIISNCYSPGTDCFPACLDHPTVYLIKDGKIVAGLRGTMTDENLIKELQTIGLIKDLNNNEL